MTNATGYDGVGSIVIVGGGIASVQTASALRAEGYDGRLHLLCGETILPYHRPPLSKNFLASTTEPTSLRPEEYYRRNEIDIRLGATVRAIDRRATRVSLEDGSQLPYDRLVLGTGARNRSLHKTGSPLHFHTIRAAHDARRLRERLLTANRIALVGGGFIGLEATSIARKMGKAVTLFEAQDRLLSRALSPEISAYLLSVHTSMGVDVHLSTNLAYMEGHRDGVTVGARDGTSSDFDAVLVAVGTAPNDSLAAEAGLEVADGILVDGNMRTSDPAIFAVGDCARFPSVHLGESCRLESIQNATDQARHVARVIVGNADIPFKSLPWFWSDQYDTKIQIAGINNRISTRVVRQTEDHAFSVFSFDGDRLATVESVNRPSDHVLGRRVIERCQNFTPEMAADPSISTTVG